MLGTKYPAEIYIHKSNDVVIAFFDIFLYLYSIDDTVAINSNGI